MQLDGQGEVPLAEEVAALRKRVAELEQQLELDRAPSPEVRPDGAPSPGVRPDGACSPGVRPDGACSLGVRPDETAAGMRELIETLSLQVAGQAALLDALPAMVFFKSRDHRYLLVNKAYADYHRFPIDHIVGKRDHEIFVPETARTYHESDEAVMASGQPKLNVELRWKLADGSDGWSLENDVPYRDASGDVIGMVGVVIDVTQRKQIEDALRLTEAELRATKGRLLDTISALSTPVLPIDDGILVLPLVGHIDSTRSAQIMEALLQGVQRYSAEFVIVDLTGVPLIDTAITSHLLRAAHAVLLLGAQCILVGISPAIAQSLVAADAGLDELILLRDLRAGVRHARARRSRRAVPTR